MCTDSKSNLLSVNPIMEEGFSKPKDGALRRCSILLELSACDDLAGFKREVEEKGLSVDEVSCWYSRRIGSKKMGFGKRTPLMVAALFGSVDIVRYIVETGKVDVNRVCDSDKVTALHCAVAGGADSSVEVVKLLLEASADANCVDANGNKPADLFASFSVSLYNSKRKVIELLLKGESLSEDEEEKLMTEAQMVRDGVEKKEYPIDVSLPDINNGIYVTDEFRMYSFKIKPCSRAYSHDWTECPFAHPGENARRRDPKKYPYTCVPCPEFRKGACQKGDNCEYAHGVFESWLHPAQYRTRLCKDETGCARKVCFFAHKPEELRPVYAATGSAMPSPRSMSVSAVDASTPSTLGSSLPLPTVSTPPMSPLATATSSPMSGGLWQNKINLTTPPPLHLPGSRLKSTLSARDLGMEMEFLRLDNHPNQMPQQQFMEEIASLSSPSQWSNDFNRIGDLKTTSLDNSFGSPSGHQIRQKINQLRSSYPPNLTSSPIRKPGTHGYDSSAAVAAALMNSRSSAFAKRSQSFIDRGAATNRLGVTAVANTTSMTTSGLSDWSSPNGALDWSIHGDELNKFKRSASFGFRNMNNSAVPTTQWTPPTLDEPDVSWVNSLVKDVPTTGSLSSVTAERFHHGKGIREQMSPWMEQMYIEQEQIVA